jgi:hypothetical protein
MAKATSLRKRAAYRVQQRRQDDASARSIIDQETNIGGREKNDAMDIIDRGARGVDCGTSAGGAAIYSGRNCRCAG